MRIIAGKFKGKLLTEFTLNSTRPTADMVREALFDKISLIADDAIFLDLFAGTGAIGIEALSRGAKYCFFVDESNEAIKIINQNLASINAKNYAIKNCDYKKALINFKNENISFDLIFLDPPYATNYAEIALEFIKNNNLLKENGLVIWEHDSTKLDYIKLYFNAAQTKKYGKKYLTYIKFDI